jgi:hypothetical protein
MKKICFIIIFGLLMMSDCKKVEGPEGKNSLIDLLIEPSGTNCSNGGYKITSGLDLNKNGVLDENEIQATKYVCNGTNGVSGTSGTNSLLSVVAESVGTNCSNGGLKIISGIDSNKNGVLDASEIQNTQYICNGVNGLNGYSSLLSVVAEPIGAICPNGGYQISTGIDSNGNGILDANEVQQIKYICNGIDGAYDKQLNFKLMDGVFNNNGNPLDYIYKYSDNSDHGMVKFNIDNYINIDSAIIIAYDIKVRDGYPGNVISGTMKLELFDCTNSKVIQNSEIISGEISSGSYAYSKNFLSYLPHEDIELGIKLTKSSDFHARTSQIVLILFRH